MKSDRRQGPKVNVAPTYSEEMVTEGAQYVGDYERDIQDRMRWQSGWGASNVREMYSCSRLSVKLATFGCDVCRLFQS